MNSDLREVLSDLWRLILAEYRSAKVLGMWPSDEVSNAGDKLELRKCVSWRSHQHKEQAGKCLVRMLGAV